MLIATKEKNGKYLELHTSARGVNWYVIEIYDCTPNGRICEKSVPLEKDVFDLLVD